VPSGSLVTPVKSISLKLRLVASKNVEIQEVTLTDSLLIHAHPRILFLELMYLNTACVRENPGRCRVSMRKSCGGRGHDKRDISNFFNSDLLLERCAGL
jgi:hypothetical protein